MGRREVWVCLLVLGCAACGARTPDARSGPPAHDGGVHKGIAPELPDAGEPTPSDGGATLPADAGGDGGTEDAGPPDSGMPDGGVTTGETPPVEILCPSRPECRRGIEGAAASSLWTMPSDGNAEAAVLPDGSAILVGMFNGPAEILGVSLPDPSEKNLSSIYAARLAPDGEVQWVRAFGLPHVGLGLTSLPVISGEAVQVTMESVDFICNGGPAINDCWWDSDWRGELLRISLSGELEPLQVGHGSGLLQAVVPIADGFVIAGRYQGGFALGGKALPDSAVDPGTGWPHWNGFVARVDLTGRARWASVVDFGNPLADERSELGFHDLALWGTDRVAFAHSFLPQQLETYDLKTGRRVLHLDLGSAPAHALPVRLLPIPGGDLVVAGGFDTYDGGAPLSLGGGTWSSSTSSDLYLARLAPTGDPRWVRTFHGNGEEFPQALGFIGDDLLMTGLITGHSGDLGGGSLAVDSSFWAMFLARFTLDGQPIWSESLGGRRVEAPGLSWPTPNGYITPRGAATLATGAAVVWGSFRGEVNFGVGDEDSHRGIAAFLLTIPDR